MLGMAVAQIGCSVDGTGMVPKSRLTGGLVLGPRRRGTGVRALRGLPWEAE